MNRIGSPVHVVSRGVGPPVLFIHGMPTSGRLWDGIVGRMAGSFTCLTLDLPGLGRTAGTPGGFRDLAHIARVIENVRTRCGIDRWHIAAHDAGCAIAVHYAHRYPGRTTSLALLTPSMFPDLKPFYLFEVLRKPLLGELLAPVIHRLFWDVAMPLALDRRKDLRPLIRDFRDPFGGFGGPWRLMALMRWGKPSEVLASIPRLLPELRTPALIFHGSKDPVVPESFARRAASLLPTSETIVLDAGHFLPLQQPQSISCELLRFFAGQPAASQVSLRFAAKNPA